MYKPFSIILFVCFFILLISCAPVNNKINDKPIKTNTKLQDNLPNIIITEKQKTIKQENNLDKFTTFVPPDANFQNNITIILSKKDNPEIVSQFVKIIELAVYKKKIENISFSIKLYKNDDDLNKFLTNQNLSGKIFIGPLNSLDSMLLEKFCSKGAVFFSFSSNKNLAKDCVFLSNFFPENELRTVFNFFPNNSKVALLYPENEYGFGINLIIDKIADQSNSIIVNRASYSADLTNASDAIKELGKYELRKYELNRQKKILANKNDEESKKRLVRLEKFKTTKDFDFTHIIIADYGLRLLQVAPLLPYYDIDPNIVQFVGTGVWDDQVFYDEPSLSGAIYPGIEYDKRQQLSDDYLSLYGERLIRTSTLAYDLVGLIDYLIKSQYTTLAFYKMIQNSNTKFAGLDGNFYFLNNIVERDLQILRINNGEAKAILK